MEAFDRIIERGLITWTWFWVGRFGRMVLVWIVSDLNWLWNCFSGKILRCGEVAERLKAPFSKNGSRLSRDVGSNPTLSAGLL